MNEYKIEPQVIYLLEHYSSPEYFKEMVDAFKGMVDTAEQALDVFMQNLPPDYRTWKVQNQPDVVWGELVLPNFRSTLEQLNIGYQRLLNGEMDMLALAGNVKSALNAQSSDYYPDWMPDELKEKYSEFDTQVGTHYLNILPTTMASWNFGTLSTRYSEYNRGIVVFPETFPIYALNSEVKVKTDEIIPKTGIYTPSHPEASAQFLIEGEEAYLANVGFDPEWSQYRSKEPVTWTLIERIADTRGDYSLTPSNTVWRAKAGEICPQTGDWWSPAYTAAAKKHFEQGDVMSDVPNNHFGAVIWYLND